MGSGPGLEPGTYEFTVCMLLLLGYAPIVSVSGIGRQISLHKCGKRVCFLASVTPLYGEVSDLNPPESGSGLYAFFVRVQADSA